MTLLYKSCRVVKVVYNDCLQLLNYTGGHHFIATIQEGDLVVLSGTIETGVPLGLVLYCVRDSVCGMCGI